MKKKDNQPTSPSRFKRWGQKKGLVAVGIIALLLVAFGIIRLTQVNSDAQAGEIYSVHVVREEDPLFFDGEVQPVHMQEEYVTATTGTLSEILVENGQEVEEGTALATYVSEENQQVVDDNNRQYEKLDAKRSEAVTDLYNGQSDLETARANIAERTAAIADYSPADSQDWDRTREFEEDQMMLSVYQGDKAEAEAAIAGAEQAIRDIDEQMADVAYENDKVREDLSQTVSAVISGLVDMKETPVSLLRESEEPILRILSEDVNITATVSEYDYKKIKPDETVQLHLATSDRVLNGTISYVSRLPLSAVEGDNAARYAFTVIPEEVIPYGFTVQVAVEEDAIYLPENAVVEEGETLVVFVHSDGVVERREIEATKEKRFFLLESGLEIEEELILDPQADLTDGQEVTVLYD